MMYYCHIITLSVSVTGSEGYNVSWDERITETSRELLMQIKEMAEDMGFEVLHGIVDCLWVVGEPISVFKEAVERETGILTEVDSYDWITFLPMRDGGEAYNRYTGIYITLLKEKEEKING